MIPLDKINVKEIIIPAFGRAILGGVKGVKGVKDDTPAAPILHMPSELRQ